MDNQRVSARSLSTLGDAKEFLCPPVTLPSRIGVGRCRMKVTVIDHRSDMVCEQTLPIDIVADASLANGGAGMTPGSCCEWFYVGPNALIRQIRLCLSHIICG